MIRELLVWDALIAWRDSILKRDALRATKTGRLSHMSRLISMGLFDLKQPLSEFLETSPENKIRAINEVAEWSKSTKQARRVIVNFFYRFARQNTITPANVIPFKEFRDIQKAAITELLSSNEDKAKSQTLTRDDILHFLSELCRINARDALATWLAWELKSDIRQILNLQIVDIDFGNGVIKLKDGFRLGELREDLKNCIKMLANGRNGLLFSTRKGKEIQLGQITRNMKIASKKIGLPIIISPKILCAHAKVYAEKSYLSMSERERNKLSNAYSKKINSIMKKGKILFAQ